MYAVGLEDWKVNARAVVKLRYTKNTIMSLSLSHSSEGDFLLSITQEMILLGIAVVLKPVSRAQVTGRAEFTSEQLRMREINTVNIRC